MSERFRYSITFAAQSVTFTVDDAAPETHRLDQAGVVRSALDSLSWYAAHTAELDCDERLLKLLGRALFELLFANHDFSGPAHERPADTKAALRGGFVDRCAYGSVQLVLHFEESALRFAQLPWEFLWVPRPSNAEDGDPVAAMDNVKVTLSLAVPTQKSLIPVYGQLRVLHATFAGQDQAPVRIDRLRSKLAGYKAAHPDRFDYKVVPDADWAAIHTAITDWQPHIFHFSGHGENDALWLATAEDAAALAEVRSMDPISMESPPDTTTRYRERITEIRKLFDRHQPELVVLDACSSNTFAAAHQPMVAHALVGTVHAVIAMRYDIGDPAAVEFSSLLYEHAIEKGRPLDEAVQAARYALVPHGQQGFSYRASGTPVLYLKESRSLCGPLEVAPPDAGGSRLGATEPPAGPCPWCDADGAQYRGAATCFKCGIWFRCTNEVCSGRRPDPYPQFMILNGMSHCPWGCGTTIPTPTVPRHGSAEPPPGSDAPRLRPVSLGGFGVAS